MSTRGFDSERGDFFGLEMDFEVWSLAFLECDFRNEEEESEDEEYFLRDV